MANYVWPAIVYNEEDPGFTFDTSDSGIGQSMQNINNIIEFTNYAKDREMWYVNRIAGLTNGQRLVNLWYYYNYLTWAGYSYYTKSVLAGLAWLVSGIASPWERRGGLSYYFMDTPQTIITTSGYVLPEFYTASCGNSVWNSDYATMIYYAGTVAASNRIYFDDGSGTLPLSAKAYNSNMSQPSTCGFGLCQWTNWTKLKYAARDAGHRTTDRGTMAWGNCYAYNVSLQCFILSHCKTLNDEGENASADNKPWMQWTDYVDPDLINNLNGHLGYDCFVMNWDEFMHDKTFQLAQNNPTTQNWLANDEGKFKLTARQWICHFNEVGSAAHLTQDEQIRYNNYIAVIKPCFEYWDSHEEAKLLNMPEPYGTLDDPWHRAMLKKKYAAFMLMLMKKRRDFYV